MKVKMSELQLGDIVLLAPCSGYRTATVCGRGKNYVEFYRPYVAHADFSMAGKHYSDYDREPDKTSQSVICYIGLEQFEAYMRDEEYEVLERGEELK